MGVQCLIQSVKLVIFFVVVTVNKSPEEIKISKALVFLDMTMQDQFIVEFVLK